MPSEPALKVLIQPPGRKPYVVTLEQLTALVRAARVLRMGRLSKTLDIARNARDSLEAEVEKDVGRYVDRVETIRKRKDEIFMKQHEALDVDVSDLTVLEKDLEDFGKNDRAGASGGNAYAGTAPPKL